MKFKSIILFLTATLLLSFDSEKPNNFRHIKNTSFKPGEYIKYKAHYGFINAAEGEMIIDDALYTVNGRPCYKIDVYGKSIGMFDLFLRIRDNWGTYLDTSAIFSHKFYRKIEEGKYRKHEIVDFKQSDRKAFVRNWDKHNDVWKPREEFEVPGNVQDIVSGYYYLRTLNFDTLKAGDIIKINAFFDDEVYNFSVRYIEKEILKTKLGKINALVLSPIMPENSLFDGENSIKVWISDDRNKVPLKIKADMFVGAVEIEITEYRQGKR